MAQQDFLDVKFAINFPESLVDSVFFGPGGSQWLENTIMFKKYAILTETISEVNKSHDQRLYNRRFIAQKPYNLTAKNNASYNLMNEDIDADNEDKKDISLSSDDEGETEYHFDRSMNRNYNTSVPDIQNDAQIQVKIKRNVSEYGILSSTAESKLSCHAPEFIPNTEAIFQNVPYLSSYLPTLIPLYMDNRFLNEYNQIYCQLDRIENLRISRRTYHYEEDGNDSGIGCEHMHSPTSPNKIEYPNSCKFNFLDYDVTDHIDYDRAFPPLNGSDKTKIPNLLGRKKEYENHYQESISHSSISSKLLKHNEKSKGRTRSMPAKKNDQTKRACVYCKRMGKNESMYDSHCLRNPITEKLMCPLLVDNTCDLCGDTKDDSVHTTNDCKNRTQKQTGFMSFELLLKKM